MQIYVDFCQFQQVWATLCKFLYNFKGELLQTHFRHIYITWNIRRMANLGMPIYQIWSDLILPRGLNVQLALDIGHLSLPFSDHNLIVPFHFVESSLNQDRRKVCIWKYGERSLNLKSIFSRNSIAQKTNEILDKTLP